VDNSNSRREEGESSGFEDNYQNDQLVQSEELLEEEGEEESFEEPTFDVEENYQLYKQLMKDM
jgi:hypothetical protein